MPAGGGTAELVARGVQPAVSPDGLFLAYVANLADRTGSDPRSSWCDHLVLVVRNLSDGSERVSIPRSERGDVVLKGLGGISGPRWSPDSKRIACGVYYEESYVFSYDVAADRTTQVVLSDEVAAALDARYRRDVPTLAVPRWTRDGDLVVQIGCYGCFRTRIEGIAGDGATVSKLTRTPDTGAPTVTNLLQTTRAPAEMLVDAPVPYLLTVPALAADERFSLRDGVLVAVTASGSTRTVFRGVRALTGLNVGGTGHAYVAEAVASHDCWNGLVWQVPVSGGVAQVFGDGQLLAISPDTRRLPVAMQTMGGCTADAEVEIWALDALEQSTRMRLNAGRGVVVRGPVEARWAPTSAQLVLLAPADGRTMAFLWNDSEHSVRMSTIQGGTPWAPTEGIRALDDAFGAGNWQIEAPRYEGTVLHARIRCVPDLAGCDRSVEFVVSGGEDGDFQTVFPA